MQGSKARAQARAEHTRFAGLPLHLQMSKLLSSMFKEISVNLGGAQGPQKGMNSTGMGCTDGLHARGPWTAAAVPSDVLLAWFTYHL